MCLKMSQKRSASALRPGVDHTAFPTPVWYTITLTLTNQQPIKLHCRPWHALHTNATTHHLNGPRDYKVTYML